MKVFLSTWSLICLFYIIHVGSAFMDLQLSDKSQYLNHSAILLKALGGGIRVLWTNISSFYLVVRICAIGAVCHQFGLLSTDLHLIPYADFVETLTRAISSCSSTPRAYMSSAKRRLVILLSPMLTFPSCFSRASDMKRSEKC